MGSDEHQEAVVLRKCSRFCLVDVLRSSLCLSVKCHVVCKKKTNVYLLLVHQGKCVS